MCANDYILIGNRFLSKEDIVRFNFYRGGSNPGTDETVPKIGMLFRDHPEELFFTCPKNTTFSECICKYLES